MKCEEVDFLFIYLFLDHLVKTIFDPLSQANMSYLLL